MSLERSYNGIAAADLKQFLEDKYLQYNTPAFIVSDPISVPHRFAGLHDREISGFMTASIAWGRRDLILRSAVILLDLMDNESYNFIISAGNNEIAKSEKFVHRAFNGTDCMYFLKALRNIYENYSGMEDIIVEGIRKDGILIDGLSLLRKHFFSSPHAVRTEKHFADIKAGAAGKRLNMFLRIIKVAE
jgi:uncharacterized protein (TIGR02757 family)